MRSAGMSMCRRTSGKAHRPTDPQPSMRMRPSKGVCFVFVMSSWIRADVRDRLVARKSMIRYPDKAVIAGCSKYGFSITLFTASQLPKASQLLPAFDVYASDAAALSGF